MPGLFFDRSKTETGAGKDRYNQSGRIAPPPALHVAIDNELNLIDFRLALINRQEQAVLDQAFNKVLIATTFRFGPRARETMFTMLQELLEAGAGPNPSDEAMAAIAKEYFERAGEKHHKCSNTISIGNKDYYYTWRDIAPNTEPMNRQFVLECFALLLHYGAKINWLALKITCMDDLLVGSQLSLCGPRHEDFRMLPVYMNMEDHPEMRERVFKPIVSLYNAMTGLGVSNVSDILAANISEGRQLKMA